MELEKGLRTALGRKTVSDDPLGKTGGFLSARQLFKKFAVEHSKYKSMHSSFDYILKICNAAIHGQQVPESHAHEAIHMGIRMLDEIRSTSE